MSGTYNFADILSLDKAKLRERKQVNALGTQELLLEYNNVSSVAKQEAMDWLQENRMELSDPEFGFRTYGGSWVCIAITYSEAASTVAQRFRIDAGIGDIATQEGDPYIATMAGVSAFRFYYPRINNPEDYQLPDAGDIVLGDVWNKRMQDNGDGTFDVMIERIRARSDLYGFEHVMAATYEEVSDTMLSGPPRAFVNPGYAGWQQVALPVAGQIIRIENTPNEDGTFRSTVIQRDAIAARVPASGYIGYKSDYGQEAGRLIVAENQTLAQFQADLAAINPSGAGEFVVSPSIQINDYGLYNYTISARV